MIPLNDASRRPVSFPIMTVLIILTNAVMFYFELMEGNTFILHWAMVPANIVNGRDWITVLTDMFMHAGWSHILGNMIFFWVFGPEI